MTETAVGVVTRPRQRRARDPLLRSKITKPSLPDWLVSRSRIEKRIAQGVQGPLTVVSGPPGAGKTMAIASWAANCGPRPVAWVTLDDYDNEPRIFWSYVVEALHQAGVAVSGAAATLAQGEATGYVFLLRLASALAANDPPMILVLDDLHLLSEPTTLGGLAYVLRNARSGFHLVVASRIDPLLPLHHYRLTGDLTEIRASDLAFSVPEAALLMAQHGITLPAESLEYVTMRDEGWAAGLRMAAMSMDGHPDPEQFVKNFVAEDSAVAGYLVEEVLNTQPADLRNLLLATSILDQVNADIAGELVADEHAASALPALAGANAFVQPVGRGWYRFHSLFKDVLRLKLRREQPGKVADLHRRAARWHQLNGNLADAVRHASYADDQQLAARILIDELALGQLMGPRDNGLLTDGFPPGSDIPARPQSLLAAAATALSAARAENLLARIPESLLVRHPEAHAHVLSGRGVVELWSGNLGRAALLLDRAASLLDAAAAPGNDDERATCYGYLALLEALRGRLSHAAELAAAGIVAPGDSGSGPPSASAAVALALVHLERNELNDSRRRLKSVDTALRAHPDKLLSAVAGLVAARGSLAEGRAQTAAEMVGRARNGWSPPPWLDGMLTVAESQAYAAAGDIETAVDAARRAGPESALAAAVALARALLA